MHIYIFDSRSSRTKIPVVDNPLKDYFYSFSHSFLCSPYMVSQPIQDKWHCKLLLFQLSLVRLPAEIYISQICEKVSSSASVSRAHHCLSHVHSHITAINSCSEKDMLVSAALIIKLNYMGYGLPDCHCTYSSLSSAVLSKLKLILSVHCISVWGFLFHLIG